MIYKGVSLDAVAADLRYAANWRRPATKGLRQPANRQRDVCCPREEKTNMRFIL